MPLPPVLRRRRGARPVLAAVLAAAALCGCTSAEELDVDGFAPGACTDLVPTLQDVDEALHQVEDEDLSPREAADRLKTAQDALTSVGGSADEPLSASVKELVTQLGFFRIAVDSNSYDGGQDADIRAALEGVAQDCREG